MIGSGLRLWWATTLTAVLAVSCAPRATPPVPGAPHFPDFVFPAVPSGLGDRVIVEWHNGAWSALQAGDLRTAERRFAAVLSRAPGFYPAATALGYVELARQAPEPALRRFAAALEQAAAYAPALVGRGDALLAADRPAEALASFEAALAADPDLAAVRSRIEVLRFRALEAEVARARQAADGRRYADAQQAYERALSMSPDSAFLHRELAVVEREMGQLDRAVAHARRAVDLDPSDARAYAALGDIHAAGGDYGDALEAFERAETIEPSEALRSRIGELRDRARLAGLPEEYRAIPQATELTRAQLAALIAVQLDGLVRQARRNDAVFVTDIRGDWAETFILAVARAGVMEVYPNYTFQPGATVRRGELASVASQLLTILASSRPDVADRWRNPSYAFSDLAPGHLSYQAAALAVAAGVLPVLAGDSFQLSRVVTGPEAMAAIERIEKLAGAPR